VLGDSGWLSRRSPRLLGLARVLAWGAGYGAALVVAYAYPALPEELTLSRWAVAPKSMFFALRVPLINLAAIGLCEIMARVLGRAPPEQRHVAECAGAALLCTAGIKALLSGIDIVNFEPRPSNAIVAFVVVATGLSLAAWFAQPILANGGLRALRSTRLEQLLGVALVAAIVFLNLPLFFSILPQRWFPSP
jgi:hypothetical protein